MSKEKKELSELKEGDPRRVVSNLFTEELLWGCDNEEESSRMADIIVNSGFLAITLNERGSKSFAFLKNASAGIRTPYFVSCFQMGAISGGPMLLGQFLFEFEKNPIGALPLNSGGTNRIYFRMDGHQDKRVQSYDFLNEKEAEDVKSRLLVLAQQHSKYQETINMIIGTLDK